MNYTGTQKEMTTSSVQNNDYAERRKLI